jgi:glycosyltransferase involved in cell wall biosynthesis
MRILILTIKPGLRGGISGATKDVYDCLGKHKNIKIDFFYYGEKKNFENIIGKLFGRIIDLFLINKKILQFDPDAIHIDSSFNKKAIIRDFATIIILSIRRKKSFFLFHGGDPLAISKNIIYKFLGEKILNSCSAFAVLSSEEALLYKRLFRLNKKPILFRYGLYPLDEKSGKTTSNQKKSILFIARIIKQKGIFETIKAFHMLREKIPGWQLMIVGDGTALSRAKGLVSNGKIKNVLFCGQVNDEKAKEYYQDAGMMVLPTYYGEGFPLSIVHSLRYGVPIITTRARGMADYLRQPNNCLWCKMKDPKNLADKILNLVSDEAMRRSISKNNLNLSKIFSANDSATKLEQIYSGFLK